MPFSSLLHVRRQLAVIGCIALTYLLTVAANEFIFRNVQFAAGIKWVYLPAGMRMLCTLLFGGTGAIGILLASLISSLLYYYPHDPVRAIFTAGISALAPYVVYLIAIRKLGLRASLINLTAPRLMLLILLYSIACPLMHQSWNALNGDTVNVTERFVVMFIGNLSGTLIIVYMLRLGLKLVLRVHASAQRASR